ncbi:MAG TPA: hypothetical protein VGI45_09160 [Terracidiphilus sp.]|jgi:hypothetical protein
MVTAKQQQASIPNRIPFKAWKRKFDKLYMSGDDYGKAFRPWMAHLEIVYELTMPLLASHHEKDQQDQLHDAILDMETRLRSLIGGIDSAGSKVVPRSGLTTFTIETLRQRLEEARHECHRTLRMVRALRKEQDPKPYTHCMPLILELRDAGVNIKHIAAICLVVMQAHGFRRNQLSMFTPKSVTKKKTLQKAISAHEGKVARLIHRMESEK